MSQGYCMTNPGNLRRMKFTLKFLKDLPLYDTVQPYKIHSHPDIPEELQTNLSFEHIDSINARDARDLIAPCLIEKHGFEFLNCPSRSLFTSDSLCSDSPRSAATLQDYIQESMGLVERRFNAEKVITMDWRVSDH